jgi:anti-sigma factor RsiW
MCPDHELLSAHVDGEVPSPWSERIEQHLAVCHACAEAAERYRNAGFLLREHASPEEIAIVDRLRDRLDESFRRYPSGASGPAAATGSRIWRRSISLPFPLAVAAALAILLLSGVATTVWLRPAKPAIESISASEIAAPIAQPASMDDLLRFLDSQNAQATLTIRLPTGTTFDNPGRPVIMRASDSALILPVNGGSP